MRSFGKASVFALALGLLASQGWAASGNGQNGGVDGNSPNGSGSVISNQQILFHSEPGVCRDVFTSGIKLRNAVAPAGGGDAGTINVPANVAANAVFAYLFWVTLDNQVPPNTETFNGNALARVPCGPVTEDPCWPTNFAYAWGANVLPFLQNGVNSLAGFPDDGVLGGAPNTEGATLVVVFNSNFIDKEILVYCGNDLINENPGEGGSESATLVFPPLAPVGIGADLTYVVGDGQEIFSDEAYWNGVALDNGNAFEGLDPGPGTTAGGGGYWDTLHFGVGIAAANSTTVTGFTDCLNWVATVLATKRGGCVVPTKPTTWSGIKTRLQ